ncbi:MAG: DUF4350 domain-containing protein [Gemmatimonadota bacterium]|nr:DUF4350 domain-containing protein [Gemmatimonadota bacterium]
MSLVTTPAPTPHRGRPGPRPAVAKLLSCATGAFIALAAAGDTPRLAAQQVADPDFAPPIERPEFAPGTGPLVAIDAAHNNFHTADGRYASFAALLERDGFVVRSNEQLFTRATLARIDILVIANALADENVEDWTLPNPSAFTDAEIEAVEEWVSGGGSLWLIADHMPIAGNAEALAAAFGVRFYNGFAFDADGQGRATFSRSRGTLLSHAVTEGRGSGEAVDSVTTFTGQAFRVDRDVDASPLIVLPEGFTVFLPTEAWVFSDSTPRVSGAGLYQGVAIEHGEGRAAIFGEAAGFSAQLAGPEHVKVGMNAPEAGQNYRLVLNTARWLAGRLQAPTAPSTSRSPEGPTTPPVGWHGSPE